MLLYQRFQAVSMYEDSIYYFSANVNLTTFVRFRCVLREYYNDAPERIQAHFLLTFD